MDPVIIDNFLSPRYFATIKELIEHHSFSWNFKKDITHLNDPNSTLDSFGFDNCTINNYESINSQISYVLTGFYGQLLDTTKCTKLSKCRIDMTMFSPTKHRHAAHVDLYEPHIASVFYITDSDAETILYDKQCFSEEQYKNNINFDELKITNTITPKENRLLFFDGSYLHTGCSPSKYKNRIIINSDLIK